MIIRRPELRTKLDVLTARNRRATYLGGRMVMHTHSKSMYTTPINRVVWWYK